MNTTDSSKVSDANAGANNVIHIPHNPTLAGLATLTRNGARCLPASCLQVHFKR